ncbi:uncharacterized protein LOC129912061 [Episyrphus balteatus]|uniref:uncharacterized protein LOC129912061 n=1 Tax=Episyrphus balteatus TaxID=286459 RepID=UPI0024857BD5|nr:uncharacterized protein LOC129912061 [Episyrphus balteatus]
MTDQHYQEYPSTSSHDRYSPFIENPMNITPNYESSSTSWSDPRLSPSYHMFDSSSDSFFNSLNSNTNRNAAPVMSVPMWWWRDGEPYSGAENITLQTEIHQGPIYRFPIKDGGPIFISTGDIPIAKFPHPKTHKIDTSNTIHYMQELPFDKFKELEKVEKLMDPNTEIEKRAFSKVMDFSIYPSEFQPMTNYDQINFKNDIEVFGRFSHTSIVSHRPDPVNYPDNVVSYMREVYIQKNYCIIEKHSQFYHKKSKLACVNYYITVRASNALLEAKERCQRDSEAAAGNPNLGSKRAQPNTMNDNSSNQN